MNQDIKSYNNALSSTAKDICELLRKEINEHLIGSTCKVWHGHPVWFLDENPIVGYAKRKENIQLLFWSGQTFEEKNLEVEGTFKAAQIRYTNKRQINIGDLKRWLKKAREIQWDYKNIVKRRGVLERIK